MALTRITKGVIKPNENYDTHNINSTGIITATKFVGPVTGAITGTAALASGLTGTPSITVQDVVGVGATFTGNVSIGGTLTYEDVTNIDSVGLITARSGINVTGGVVRIANTNFSAAGNADELVIGTTSGNRGLTIVSGNTNIGALFFADDGSTNIGSLVYQHDTNQMRMNVAGAQIMRLDYTNSIPTWIIGTDLNTHISLPSADTFAFTTGGDERLRIASNGRIGIGTITPQSILDVRGNTEVRDARGNQNFFVSDSAFKYFQSVSNWNNMTYTASPVLGWDWKNGPGDLFYIGSGGNTALADQMVLVVSDGHGVKVGRSGYDGTDYDVSSTAEYFRITNDGKVWIGTTTGRIINSHEPRLQVSGDDYKQSTVSIINNAADATGAYLFFSKQRSGSGGGNTAVNQDDIIGDIRFTAGDGTDIETGAARITVIAESNASGNSVPSFMRFSTTSTTGPEERLRIKANGKVGVNTTTPAQQFTSYAASGYPILANGPSNGIGLGNNGAIVFGTKNLGAYAKGILDASEFEIKISGSPKVYVHSNGKVGIGTDVPDANLTVHTTTQGQNVFNIHADFGTNNNRTFNLYAPATDSSDDPYIFQTGNSMQFKVDSHEGIKIHTNGKVGIGITEPKQPLSIAGRVSIDVNNDYYGVWADGSTTGENHISVGRWYNTGGGLKSGYTQYGINNLILENNHATANHSLIIQPNGQKVAIGTHITDGLVHIGQLTAGSVSADADADELVLESSGNTGMSILSPSTGESSIYFGNPGTNGQKDGWIKYYHETHSTTANRRNLVFATGGNTERLRINSSGKIGIGDGSTSASNICDPDGNQLLIRGASTVGTAKGHIMLTGDSATVGQGPQIVFSESGSGSNNAGAYIGHIRQGSNSIGDLVFGTRATSGDANTVPTERLRITSGGIIQVGAAVHDSADIDASNTKLTIKQTANAMEDGIYIERSGERKGYYIRVNPSGGVGDALSITTNNNGSKNDAMYIDRDCNINLGVASQTDSKSLYVGGKTSYAVFRTHNNRGMEWNYNAIRSPQNHSSGISGWVLLGHDYGAAPYPVRTFKIAVPESGCQGTRVYQVWHDGDANYDYGGLYEVRINQWTSNARFESVSIRCINGHRNDMCVRAYNDSNGIMLRSSSIWGRVYIRLAGYDDNQGYRGSSYCAVANNGALAIYNSQGTDDGTVPTGGSPVDVFCFDGHGGSYTGGRDIENSNWFAG